MAIINTNISAIITQQAMAKNDRAMQTTMERLSTGKSVNSAQDDAAGIAVSSRMTSQIKGLDQAVQNAGDAISMIQTADGASIELGNMMQRMRELAVQATNGTVTTTDQGSLDLEFQQLKAEIARVAKNSQWNGDNILDGTAGTASNGTATYQIGANAQQVMDVSFGDWSLNAPTANVSAVYSSAISSAQAQTINGPLVLSDGTNTLRIDYSSGNVASPADLNDLVTDITSHAMYSKMKFTVAANGTTGINITYGVPEAVATPPTVTGASGYTAPVRHIATYDMDDTDVGTKTALKFTQDGVDYVIPDATVQAYTSTEDLVAGINAIANFPYTATNVADLITLEAKVAGAKGALSVTQAGGVAGTFVPALVAGVAEVAGTNVSGSVTVSTEGKSVTGVAAVYRTALSDANAAAIDGNLVFSDGENTLTVDASGVTTLDALASAVTSHADHADLGFTVSKQPAVPGVAAQFSIATFSDANVATIAGANAPILISDGTNTIEISTQNPDKLAGTDTLANLVTQIQADPLYTAGTFKFTVAAGANALTFTATTNGVATGGLAVSTGASGLTHAITNPVAGTDAIAQGLTFTYESAKAVLSTPTFTANDGGFDIASALTNVTAGFTAVKGVFGRDISGLSIATDTNANTALAELDAAMDGINAQRAIYGAGMNRLEYAIDNLSNGSQNAAASRSRIEDADYAIETTELARTQIIQQAGTAMLAQANQANQSVLALLKG